MEHILIKVYGSVQPATQGMCDAARNAAQGMGELDDIDEVVALDGSLLTFHFEGMYFPLDDVLAALGPMMGKECEGRIDYIDMDEWTLTRFWIQGGLVTQNTASLNQVMDYSGH